MKMEDIAQLGTGLSGVGAIANTALGFANNSNNRDLQREANRFAASQSDASFERSMQAQTVAAQRNNAQALENRKFQERMSSTQLQRGVLDAKAAGLHPSLATGGASSPAGSPSTSGAGSAPPASATAIPLQAPQINMPDLFQMGISMKNIDLAEKRLKIDGERSAAEVRNKLSSTELNDVEAMMKKMGIFGKTTGSEFSNQLLDFLKGMFKRSKGNSPRTETPAGVMVPDNSNQHPIFRNNLQ